jgi:peroxiredoxin (alkyl hydroperoxide reductase subunit C)
LEPSQEDTTVCETTPLKLGQVVPNFELDTYDPKTGDFGKFSLAKQLEKKRWTILFFYPADFTFV